MADSMRKWKPEALISPAAHFCCLYEVFCCLQTNQVAAIQALMVFFQTAEEQDTLSEALKTMKAFTNDANSSQKAILEEQLRNLRKQFNVVCNDMRNNA